MVFFYNSIIVFYGSFKFFNCVVDSRFVFKIIDYGLVSFRLIVEFDDSYVFYVSEVFFYDLFLYCFFGFDYFLIIFI